MPKELIYKEVFHNNFIIIVNAIPDGQLQSARRVAENIQDHFQAIQAPGYCFYEKITTTGELRKIFASLEYYCSKENAYPVLHIEAHGIRGVGLDICGEVITWKELYDLSKNVNILAKNNFGLVLASCYGNEITEAVEIDSPCPFRFVLGPYSEVKAGEIEDQTTSFYKEVISTGDLNSALSCMEEQFIYFICSRFFLTAMARFFAKRASGIHQKRAQEEMLTRTLEGIPNTRHVRKIARAGIKRMFKDPENFIMDNMKIFLHGETPISYAELKSFYAQFIP